MKMTNYIFDLGGVLINLDMEGMKRACELHGIGPELFFVKESGESVSTVCNGMAASKVLEGYQVGEVSTDAVVDRVLQFCPGISRQCVVDTWNACLGDLPKERLDMISHLRAEGHRTYLLSNTNDLHWQHIVRKCFSEEGYGVDDLFDGVFLSHEMHLAKPDRAIYREVVRRIGEPADTCLFIDDSMANVKAAEMEGIPSRWLDLASGVDVRALLKVV